MVEHKFRPDIDPNDDNFVPIEVGAKARIDLFTTPVFGYDLDFNNQEIIDECLELKQKYPNGVSKSNFGGGWQSQVYELAQIRRGVTPAIQNLARNVIDLTNDMLECCNSPSRVSDDQIGWWININKGMAYNVYHTHPGCSVIGIYYPLLPDNLGEQEGNFTILRQDASNHNAAFADIDHWCEWTIRPEVSKLYLMPSTVAHYVTPHSSDQERISIAFNIG